LSGSTKLFAEDPPHVATLWESSSVCLWSVSDQTTSDWHTWSEI